MSQRNVLRQALSLSLLPFKPVEWLVPRRQQLLVLQLCSLPWEGFRSAHESVSASQGVTMKVISPFHYTPNKNRCHLYNYCRNLPNAGGKNEVVKVFLSALPSSSSFLAIGDPFSKRVLLSHGNDIATRQLSKRVLLSYGNDIATKGQELSHYSPARQLSKRVLLSYGKDNATNGQELGQDSCIRLLSWTQKLHHPSRMKM